MAIYYESLDAEVRRFMVQELEIDLTNKCLYLSPRLTDEGQRNWASLIREAIEDHDDAWLANALRSRSCIRAYEQRRNPKGNFTRVRVPNTAPDTLAGGEFNRFYARGLCAQVISAGGSEVEVYRGKDVRNPRVGSEQMIGRRLPAQNLLNDLRRSQGVEPALGFPPGPNSGLTIRQIRTE